MRFGGELLAQLHIPRETNRHAPGMFRQPSVIVPAALAEPLASGSEADQRHEQHNYWSVVNK